MDLDLKEIVDFLQGGGVADVPQESLMLTGDENIVNIDFSVFWVIKDAGKFLFEIQDPEGTVKAAAETAMREVIAKSNIQPILTEGRASIEIETQEIIQSILDEYNSGIQVTQVQTQKADPPDQVIDAFRDVQAARADMERSKNEAEAYANDVIPRARGEAAKIMQAAEAYKQKVVASAEGEASRFISIYNEYAKAKEVTQERMYLETMEKVLADIDKVIIEKNAGSGVVPYLPLPELGKKKVDKLMKMQKILLPVIIIIGALAFFSIFIVKEVNQAIVLQFGDPKKIILKPGLNFKMPFIQNVVFLDSRILNLDTPPIEVIASDQKRLIVDAFARFQIIDPLKFYISVGNERVARSRLATIINSRLRNVLGQQELQTLLSKDRSKQMALIQEGVNAEAKNFGIKIVDVRIKRADLPEANSEAIFRRMQTEREKEAKEFRARGAEMAVTITSTADKDVSVLLANANKDSEIMKGQGDGERNKIFADAFGRDPEFFAFYRAMQAYETALIGGDTSVILSPDSEFFKFFGNIKPKK